MVIRFGLLLISFASLSACISHSPEIQSLCFRDDIGNYIIKWETTPQIDGTIKLFVSDTPDQFNKSKSAGYANIQDGITKYVTDDNITRKYFMLSFNDKYFKTVASRPVVMDSIQNFRDLGGYASTDNGKSIHWGKVFRSGKIGEISERDSTRLDGLKIKTIIDLRTNEEVTASPIGYKNANIVHIPIPIKNISDLVNRLAEGRIRKGDGILFMQDLYLQYVTENKEEFSKALSILEDENNYPVIIHCTIGKDRIGFMTAMLLSILDIPEETIYQDYTSTNDYLDLKRYSHLVSQLNYDGQEALTAMLTANESFIDLAFAKIRKDYGSIDKYLKNELHISEKQQERIKEILLL
ncbi:MAG: tyrosine-protein phosphatase [Tannerellaceae bacterium]|jgi:protein-tyrosine phosphatase|nr:tyrosine-protein phosphatase [Tannerellaceae bacterium]